VAARPGPPFQALQLQLPGSQALERALPQRDARPNPRRHQHLGLSVLVLLLQTVRAHGVKQRRPRHRRRSAERYG